MMAETELTAAQVAKRLGVSGASVRSWCQQGLLPNAYMHETPLGALWMIPEKDVKKFQAPKMGRPPKSRANGPDGKVNVKPSKKGGRK
jgi:hypothetical protein